MNPAALDSPQRAERRAAIGQRPMYPSSEGQS
jgi:hypothetical protein